MTMCDAKSITTFLEQDLEEIDNHHEQRMVEHLMPNNIEVNYVPGKKMEVPDCG